MTCDVERKRLLRTARRAIAVALSEATVPELEPEAMDEAASHAGVFVTLHEQGQLLGCIGHLDADAPLADLVRRCAVAASQADPRFPPLVAADLSRVHIELSVLAPPELVSDVTTIEIGRHGLIVEMNGQRGLLLPQTARSGRWDRETFLHHTCHNAGLSLDAWKMGATIWRFEAEVFEEE